MIYKIENSDETFYTDAAPDTIRAHMWAYLRKKTREGSGLTEIRYVYGPVYHREYFKHPQALAAETRRWDSE